MKHSNTLILASDSPRRKQILGEAGIPFVVKKLPYKEVYPKEMHATAIPEYLAKEKNLVHRKKFTDELILTADTGVVLENTFFGKPHSPKEAIKTLTTLQGKTHQVITGVCISSPQIQHAFSCLTKVTFAALSKNEIQFYVERYKPFDKAGSYAIQEWIGWVGIERIEGSYANVVGLPMSELYTVLKEKFGFPRK